LKKQILLTFDLEEFDLPLEFGCPISEEDQIKVTNNGLERLTGLLSKYNIPATFFTTAGYAGKNSELVKSLSATHEIASHSKSHSCFSETDPSESKLIIESITGKKVNGFRMPRFAKIDRSIVKRAGYSYDSSVNPTLIPGRYNNLFSQRKIHRDRRSGLIEIPVSVSPIIRFPLFWLTFKNIPSPIYFLLCNMAIKKDSYLHLCFHPWEFDDLEPFNIPWYVKTLSGKPFLEKFERLIATLMKNADFSTISGFLESSGLHQSEE
jgi:hypothetical protein